MKRSIRTIAALLGCTLLLGLCACNSNDPVVEESTEPVNPPSVTLYVGLNDADTGFQMVRLEEAQVTIRKLITNLGYGYTEVAGYGAYVDGDKVVGNDTLLYTLFNLEIEDAKELALTIQAALNLTPIMVQEGTNAYGFVEPLVTEEPAAETEDPAAEGEAEEEAAPAEDAETTPAEDGAEADAEEPAEGEEIPAEETEEPVEEEAAE